MMNTPENFIAAKASEAVAALFGAEIDASQLQVQVTRKEFEGDFTLVVFPLLKLSRMAPENTGRAIGDWLVANVPESESFNCVKGFLNLCFSNLYWNEFLSSIASDADFGRLSPTGKTVMVEFSSPNTNKPLHLGHVRNNLLGASVSEILKAAGNDVIKTTLVNDRGVHICKSMYAWLKRSPAERRVTISWETAMSSTRRWRRRTLQFSTTSTRCSWTGRPAILRSGPSGRR